MVDKISPGHYKSGNMEVIDIIESYGLNFHRGNVLKYLLRAGRKAEKGYTDHHKEIEDLKKAVWYLNREINRLNTLDVTNDVVVKELQAKIASAKITDSTVSPKNDYEVLV